MDALQYTICFIKRGNELLLINKEAKIWMGRWNGIGGKIQQGETPEECIIREVKEETGICLSQVTYKGIVTWTDGGMHVFFAELPKSFHYKTPVKNREGILDWKQLDWIMHPENRGLADHLPKYLPNILGQPRVFEYRCLFDDEKLVGCEAVPLNL
jgi:8-oxo-dGTP diphosphatase